MLTLLLLGSVVIIACILCNRLSNKAGIPMLLGFILLGMIFGSDGIFKIPFENFEFAEQICTIALIFIMFYGGFNTNWQEAKKVAVKSLLLSSLGVVITAALTAVFCHFVLKFQLLESCLVGAVLSSTDAASVFSILRSKKLSLKYSTSSLLEMESGSNDPFAYLLMVFVLSLMKGGQTAGSLVYLLFSQIVYGAGLAVIIALAAIWFLRKFNFENSGFETAFVFAVAVFAYALPSVLGGNGFLSVYILGIIVGNHQFENKKQLVHFFDGVTNLMQMLIFFLLGLLAFPSQMPSIIVPSLLIALFLTLVARPAATFAILTPFKAKINQQLMVSWAGLRGAASIVFAIFATVGDAYTKNDLFHIVFCVVLFSIGIQGTLLPFAAKKLHMIDTKHNVEKTFNDYSEENEIQFISLNVTNGHPWIDKKIKEISLPPSTLLVMILRDGATIIPNGETDILLGDILIVSAAGFKDVSEIHLTEIVIDEDSELIGKNLSESNVSKKALILMIKRGETVIIPNGESCIQCGDILVLNPYKNLPNNKKKKQRKP